MEGVTFGLEWNYRVCLDAFNDGLRPRAGASVAVVLAFGDRSEVGGRLSEVVEHGRRRTL